MLLSDNRPVNVREGDKVITLPAIQAVLRSQVALAAKGDGPAQRTVIEAIQAIEREIEAHLAPKGLALDDKPSMSDVVARRIAFILASRLLRRVETRRNGRALWLHIRGLAQAKENPIWCA